MSPWWLNSAAQPNHQTCLLSILLSALLLVCPPRPVQGSKMAFATVKEPHRPQQEIETLHLSSLKQKETFQKHPHKISCIVKFARPGPLTAVRSTIIGSD